MLSFILLGAFLGFGSFFIDYLGYKEIKRYDFEFSAWPVQYEFNKNIVSQENILPVSWRSLVSSLFSSPCSVVGFFVMHTFGIRLLYPGSMTILNFLLRQTQMDGRINLIENLGGERFKLKTIDRNYIDTMFVDKRKSNSIKGKFIVICSEGNAGFYENGIMPTAIEAGYSVLGWNHPGFGCSTGMPYMEQEHNAMDTVMQFVVHDLKFNPEQIILFGWSIGGYSSSYASSRYPSVKQVIVDATFDDVLPLAQNQMPEFLDSIVRRTIRCYADLNVAENLVEYQGPIKMVRRTQDEVICIEPFNISTNRGNFLLHKILKRRYPALFNPESEGSLINWFSVAGSQKNDFVSGLHIRAPDCEAKITSYKNEHGDKFPFSGLGKGLPEEESTKLLIYLNLPEDICHLKKWHAYSLGRALFAYPGGPKGQLWYHTLLITSKALINSQVIANVMSGEETLTFSVEFSGGAELLFDKIKKHKLDLPASGNWTIGKLLFWLKDNLLTERPELFLQDSSVRPGILVLVNDTDWELLDQLKYEIAQGDVVTFISTLHGG